MDPQNQTTIAQSKSPVRVTAWVLIRLLDGIALLILFLALTPVGWLAVGLARDFGISKPVAIVGGILIAVGGFSCSFGINGWAILRINYRFLAIPCHYPNRNAR